MKFILIIFSLLLFSCDFNIGQKEIIVLEPICKDLCGKLNCDSYFINASFNGFGQIFYYYCLCNQKGSLGSIKITIPDNLIKGKL